MNTSTLTNRRITSADFFFDMLVASRIFSIISLKLRKSSLNSFPGVWSACCARSAKRMQIQSFDWQVYTINILCCIVLFGFNLWHTCVKSVRVPNFRILLKLFFNILCFTSCATQWNPLFLTRHVSHETWAKACSKCTCVILTVRHILFLYIV